jgi:hypothetical protein
MNLLFSARGARRGLALAGLCAALWGAWALGYLHGSGYFAANPTFKASAIRVQASLTHPPGDFA